MYICSLHGVCSTSVCVPPQSVIPESDYTMFLYGHQVRLGTQSLAMFWSGDWQHYKFVPDQSSFTSLRVVGEEDQETVNHGYRMNIKESVVGVV